MEHRLHLNIVRGNTKFHLLKKNLFAFHIKLYALSSREILNKHQKLHDKFLHNAVQKNHLHYIKRLRLDDTCSAVTTLTITANIRINGFIDPHNQLGPALPAGPHTPTLAPPRAQTQPWRHRHSAIDYRHFALTIHIDYD